MCICVDGVVWLYASLLVSKSKELCRNSLAKSGSNIQACMYEQKYIFSIEICIDTCDLQFPDMYTLAQVQDCVTSGGKLRIWICSGYL